jgi:hypothetical protein
MFGHVLLITAVLSTPFAVRMEAASALDGTGQVPLVTVEKARCRPGDKVETGLQGQVPVGDRVSGRAAEGYFCNMTMVGGVRTRSFANFDVYGDCAYYTESPGGFGGPGADGHGNVVDVSDPTRPVVTATLTARAMGNAGESLRVNAKRGLLVADHYGNGTADPRVGTFPWLAVYDVATDCRHPRLLADVAMPHGRGHEGWFSPDGLTYFMTSVLGRTTTAVDLSDPTNPKELATWPYPVHGGSTSEDGTRSYMASVADPNAVLIVDTSDVGPGRANAGRVLSTIPITHNFGNQNAYRLDYGGHPYLLSFGESTDDATAGRCTNPADTSFDMPRFIDLADEMHPVIVSKFVNEVSDPVNCRRVSETTRSTPAAPTRATRSGSSSPGCSCTTRITARPIASATRRSWPAPPSCRGCGFTTFATPANPARSRTTTPAPPPSPSPVWNGQCRRSRAPSPGRSSAATAARSGG